MKIKSSKELQTFFRHSGKQGKPIISGHRGGMASGFPENSLATFSNTLKYTEAFFEVDPRLTKDSVVVLMHDATIDRTTTGKGKVSDYTYQQLQQFFLKDKEGTITPFKIPTLLDALKWSRNKTILNLDHKGVPFEIISNIIRKSKNKVVMMTIHSPEQAQFYLNKNPNSFFSVHIRSKKDFTKYETAKIPWKNMIAYIGPDFNSENRELLKMLHDKGVLCMISAASSFDKLENQAERANAYNKLYAEGADILESDLPIEVGKAIQQL